MKEVTLEDLQKLMVKQTICITSMLNNNKHLRELNDKMLTSLEKISITLSEKDTEIIRLNEIIKGEYELHVRNQHKELQ